MERRIITFSDTRDLSSISCRQLRTNCPGHLRLLHKTRVHAHSPPTPPGKHKYSTLRTCDSGAAFHALCRVRSLRHSTRPAADNRSFREQTEVCVCCREIVCLCDATKGIHCRSVATPSGPVTLSLIYPLTDYRQLLPRGILLNPVLPICRG